MADIEFIRCSGTNEDFIENCQLLDMVLCQDLAQNKMRSFATKLLTENRPSHRFFRSR